MAGKTITQFLIDWSPLGIKLIELSNWVWKSIQIPRANLKDVKMRPEMNQPGIYFLFGQNHQWNDICYIGEAENIMDRITSHDTKKDFWDTVIVFISKDNNLTKADVKFLEAKSIERAKKSGKYILENIAGPVPNNLPEHQMDTMLEFLENIDLLISAIWYPVIKEIDEKIDRKNETIYYLKARWSDGKWIYTEEGFIVLKGSKFSQDSTNSFDWTWPHQNRWRIERDPWLFSSIERIILQDISFSSPSSAASILAWNSLNGWIEWKTKDGKTLDEIERKSLK